MVSLRYHIRTEVIVRPDSCSKIIKKSNWNLDPWNLYLSGDFFLIYCFQLPLYLVWFSGVQEWCSKPRSMFSSTKMKEATLSSAKALCHPSSTALNICIKHILTSLRYSDTSAKSNVLYFSQALLGAVSQPNTETFCCCPTMKWREENYPDASTGGN